MIEIILNELDLTLELPEVIDPLSIDMDGSTSGLDLQVPEDFGTPELIVSEWGLLDLDLLGFPYYGKSAYELAQQQGYLGNLDEWLLSLKGEDGDDGLPGVPGILGPEFDEFNIQILQSVQNASGSALSSAQILAQVQAFADETEIYAASTLTLTTQAEVYRNETGQWADAVAQLRIEAEAFANDSGEYANAASQSQVAAQTSSANAELSSTQAVTAFTGANAAAASAIDSASAAVEARNSADDSAAASFLSQSTASSYADDARTDANAARISQIAASAARDDSQIIADAIIIDRDTVNSYVTDVEAFAEASRVSSLSANASYEAADISANASLTHSQNASASATAAGNSASAANNHRIAASTSAGEAVVSRNEAVTARGGAVLAESNSLTHAQNSGGYATAAAGHRDQAEIYMNEAGQAVEGFASRLELVEVDMNGVNGRVTQVSNVAVNAQNRVLASVSVLLDVNGYVSGWRSENNGYTGTMTIYGTSLKLVDPNGGAPFSPFSVIGNNAYFNANVQINGNLIVNGTLIGNNALQNGSVTNTVAQTWTNTLSAGGGQYIQGMELNIATIGGKVRIDWSAYFYADNTSGADSSVQVIVRRLNNNNGSYVDLMNASVATVPANNTYNVYGPGNTLTDSTVKVPGYLKTTISSFQIDNAPAGNWQYIIYMISTHTPLSILQRSLSVTENKTQQ
jgi:hypothetical protein